MTDLPSSDRRIAGNLLYPLLAAVPSTCFTGAFLTDIAYWQTANMQWANMSVWLLTFGILIAILAVIAGLIDFLNEPRIRDLSAAWIHAVGNVLVLVLSSVLE